MIPIIPPTIIVVLWLLLVVFLFWWHMTQSHQTPALHESDWGSWQKLKRWLQQSGVDTSTWGHGRAKSAEQLWREVLRGETHLLANPPRRMVELVVLIVRREEQILLEIGQHLPGENFRQRAWPPSEKMISGENFLQTAVRGLREEFGLVPDDYTLHHDTYRRAYQWRDSVSYPTLPAQYCFHIIDVDIPSLPPEPFTTTEPIRDELSLIHHWAWHTPPPTVTQLLSAG
jgi:hypothetical protein